MAFDDEIDLHVEDKKVEEEDEEEDPLWNDVDIEDIKKEIPANPILLDKAKLIAKEPKTNSDQAFFEEQDDAIISFQSNPLQGYN